MFVHVYDPRRLILFALFPTGAVQRDNDEGIVAHERLAADLAQRPLACATTVVIVDETSSVPDASQRKRMADCIRRMTRHRSAFITRSAMARSIVTAIGWLTPSMREVKRSAHASYEEARPWLIEHTGHPSELLDAMHRELRRGSLAALPRTGPSSPARDERSRHAR